MIQSPGAVRKSRWPSRAPVPNKPTVSAEVKRQHFKQMIQFSYVTTRGQLSSSLTLCCLVNECAAVPASVCVSVPLTYRHKCRTESGSGSHSAVYDKIQLFTCFGMFSELWKSTSCLLSSSFFFFFFFSFSLSLSLFFFFGGGGGGGYGVITIAEVWSSPLMSTNKKLLVSWQFSGPYGVTKYGSGWRKGVVNQCSEFDCIPATLPPATR